jgi:hypothetical protein
LIGRRGKTVLCVNCGRGLLNGFKFCHHCGRQISIVTASPEMTPLPPPPPAEDVPVLPAEPGITPEQTEAPEEAEMPEEEPTAGDISVARIFLLELLCFIPIVNFILLAVLSASGRATYLREFARGKLLALMTFTLIILTVALAVVLLMYTGVIEPIYLGRWRV